MDGELEAYLVDTSSCVELPLLLVSSVVVPQASAWKKGEKERNVKRC